MDLLSQLRDAPPPRPEPLARLVARRLDSRPAMLGFAALYCLLVANDVTLAAGYGLYRLGRYAFGTPMPEWYKLLGAVVLGVVFWLAFWPFSWWRRRRVGAALELGRTGELVKGEVAAWRDRGRTMSAVIWFSHGGQEHAIQEAPMGKGLLPADFPVGTRVPVLYAPTCARALYFKKGGVGAAGRVVHKPRA